MANGFPSSDGFVSFLITLQLILLFVAVAVVVWSAAIQVRRASSAHARGRRRSAWIAVGSTAVLLALTYLAAPTDALSVNGDLCSSSLVLRLSSMFVTSSLVLLSVGVVAVIVGEAVNIKGKRLL